MRVSSRPHRNVLVLAPDGLRLNLVDFGGEEKPALLFVHGSLGHARVWDPVIEFLPAAWHVAALDLPGHGDSARGESEERYAFDCLVEDIGVAVASVGRRPVLVGHSIGSALAMFYAADHASTLSGAVFMDIDPWPPGRQADRLNEIGEAPPKLYASLDRAIAREARAAAHATPAVHLHLALCGYRRTSEGYAQKFDQAFLRAVRTWDARPLLGRIGVPSLVLRGGESTVMSEAGYQELLHGIPQARGEHIPGASHQLHLDEPALVAQAISSFAASLRQ